MQSSKNEERRGVGRFAGVGGHGTVEVFGEWPWEASIEIQLNKSPSVWWS